MLRIELLSWERARDEASRIRAAVFVEEQGVPAQMEMDDHDAHCLHALAYDARPAAVGPGDVAIATGRLLPDGHIGRMAVLKGWRGKGVGSEILVRLMAAARVRGDSEVVLSAQTHAIEFYRRHGFEVRGEVYMDAGIPHQDMRRSL